MLAREPATPIRLLALDTSTETLSVAVRDGARIIGRQGAGGAQASAALIPLIQAVLAESGLALADLQAIAFGRGPGSFTGLRTACAVAQGLGFGTGLPLLPVDTLLAVAEQAHHHAGARRVIALLDARMDQVYAAHYEFDDTGGIPQAQTQLLAPQDIRADAGWVLAGNAFTAYGDRLPDVPRHPALPDAAAMLRLAPTLIAAGQLVAPADAMPLYVRDKVAQTTAEREAAKALDAEQERAP